MGSHQSLYAPLNRQSRQIRLIHIQPGKWDDPILCELETVSLNLGPVYQTLSYTWGEPKPTALILLDTCVVEVRINLYHALRRLRCLNSARIIWIDAICINQDDFEERAQQVMLMKRIYSKCKEVIMWLGDEVSISTQVEETQNDKLTIEEGSHKLMEYFAAQPESFRHPAMAGREGYEVYDAFIVILLLGRNVHIKYQPCFNLPTVEGTNEDQPPAVVRRFRRAFEVLGRIMALPYWNRMWIVQENILPPFATVALGSISIPWKAFTTAIESYISHINCCRLEVALVPVETKEFFKQFIYIVRGINVPQSLRQQGINLDLHALLKLCWGRQATDPRDRVYSLLSLVNHWPTGTRIVPDYSAENTPIKMFADVTVHLIQATHGFSILIRQRRFRVDVPSWVVDWVEDPSVAKFRTEIVRLNMYAHYHATNQSFVVAERLSRERLRVRGMMVATIVEIGPHIPSPMWTIHGCFPRLSTVLAMGGTHRSPCDEYFGGGTWEDAHWRTVCGDLLHQGDGSLRRTTPADKPLCLKYQRIYVNADMQSFQGREDLTALAPVHHTVMATLLNRKIFVTREGYLGLGPRDMEVGDQVWILSGSNAPFVLRAYETGRFGLSMPSHRLVGDCYVHGIMYGEAFQRYWLLNARPLVLH